MVANNNTPEDSGHYISEYQDPFLIIASLQINESAGGGATLEAITLNIFDL